MSTLQADPFTDRRYRFDNRLPLVIEWRGEHYANTRDNVTFIRLWGKILNRHAPVPVKDCFGERMYDRDAGTLERKDARTAIQMLRDMWYPR
jgi:hypothetical protein